MSKPGATLGRVGEEIAVDVLTQKGYTVLERNFRFGHQEVDVIAADRDFIVFVEVKTRSYRSPIATYYGRPARAVDITKQKNIITAAQGYLRAHPEELRQPRLDVIEIIAQTDEKGYPKQILHIEHLRNAFGVR